MHILHAIIKVDQLHVEYLLFYQKFAIVSMGPGALFVSLCACVP